MKVNWNLFFKYVYVLNVPFVDYASQKWQTQLRLGKNGQDAY